MRRCGGCIHGTGPLGRRAQRSRREQSARKVGNAPTAYVAEQTHVGGDGRAHKDRHASWAVIAPGKLGSVPTSFWDFQVAPGSHTVADAWDSQTLSQELSGTPNSCWD
eukprot:6197116-Pleurochrysis_carterae.AAC.1